MKTKGKFFLAVSLILLLAVLIVPYYLYVGRGTAISNDANDWADFATYFAAFGTMLFTALYAFAFISLQGAINKNTEAQNGKNERKDRNNVLLVLSIATSNLLQQSIEKVDSLDLNKKISDNDYHSLVSWNHKISVYLTSIDKHKEYIAEENRNYVADMLTVNQKNRDSIEFIHAHNLTDNYQKGLHVSLIQMGNMLNYLETQIFVNNIEIN